MCKPSAVARTPGQRGAVGNWLVTRRLARGWTTQDQARQEILRLTGWRIPKSVYAEWESGRRIPSDPNRDRLVEFYGGMDAAPTDPAVDVAGVVGAVSLLVEELRAERAARVEWEQGLLEALRDIARAAVRSGDPELEPRVGAQR